jgi:hypothetical protein
MEDRKGVVFVTVGGGDLTFLSDARRAVVGTKQNDEECKTHKTFHFLL